MTLLQLCKDYGYEITLIPYPNDILIRARKGCKCAGHIMKDIYEEEDTICNDLIRQITGGN